MAITGEPDGHQWGAPMTISGEISMAIDKRPAVDAARPAAPVAGLRGARTGVVAPGPAGAPAAFAEHTHWQLSF